MVIVAILLDLSCPTAGQGTRAPGHLGTRAPGHLGTWAPGQCEQPWPEKCSRVQIIVCALQLTIGAHNPLVHFEALRAQDHTVRLQPTKRFCS